MSLGYLYSAPQSDVFDAVELDVDPRAAWLRPIVAFDFETHPFTGGVQFPRLVCASFVRRFLRHKTPRGWRVFDDGNAIVRERARALPILRDILAPWDRPWPEIVRLMRAGAFKRPLLVNQSIAFDLGVVCAELPELTRAVFHAYRAGDVRCTETREKGHRAALGTMQFDAAYGLDDLARRYLGRDLTAAKKGPDKWRGSFHLLEGLRAEDYPQEAHDYSREDPELALGVFECQALACAEAGWYPVEPWLDEPLGDLELDLTVQAWPDEEWQTREAFWLKLVGAWGMVVDSDHVFELKAKLEANIDEAYSHLRDLSELPSGARIATASRAQLEDALRFGGVKIRSQPKTWSDARMLGWLRDKARRTFALVARKPNGEWKQSRYVVQARVAAASTGNPWPDEYCASRDELLERCEAWRDAGVAMSEPSKTFPHGQPAYGAGELRETGDDLLEELASVSKDAKELGTYIPFLERAALESAPVHSHYNIMVANGRTSSSQPNEQNPPRRPGVREAHVPRPGTVFVNADLDAAELCTLAQTNLDWFGESALADDLCAGRDPHLGIGAELLGISYDEALAMKKAKDPAIKEPRNCGKSGNFGAAGGLGEHTFSEFARDTYGVPLVCLCRKCERKHLESDREYRDGRVYKVGGVITAAFVLDVWRARRPIVAGPYFDTIAAWCEQGFRLELGDGRQIKIFRAEHPRSGRIRGGLRFTAGCNTFFSAPVADAAKRSGFWVALECHLGERTCDACGGLGFQRDSMLELVLNSDVREPGAPLGCVYSHEEGLRYAAPCPACDGTGDSGAPSELLGCRPVNFLHDEHMIEAPVEYAAEAGERLAEIMKRELGFFCPDIAAAGAVNASPWIMDRWYKAADTTRDRRGRLTVWSSN